MHIRRDYLETASGTECFSVDIEKMRPVARLGYGQEYTAILEMVAGLGKKD